MDTQHSPSPQAADAPRLSVPSPAFASMRNSFDLSAYLVLGPDDTHGRAVEDIVAAALRAGITFVQLRAKHSDASEIIDMAGRIARTIADAGKSATVPLVIDDRLDATWQARCEGIKVDGVHVGQTDISVEYCRTLLGPDAIVGLSANTEHLIDVVNALPEGVIDYVGAGPVHPTISKADAGIDENGVAHNLEIEGIRRLSEISGYPVVAGGGVTAADMPELARTKVAGWFVISAIAGKADPERATRELIEAWKQAKRQHA
ncbi:MAG: thiamine phosphate synthase [Bifidobacterium psychraerophilum]|uniref:thiamine phosphate synthase n=1 Tax=Bifidobacterium psychraerophilum TaxID=218140 RepID=UPI0039EC0775